MSPAAPDPLLASLKPFGLILTVRAQGSHAGLFLTDGQAVALHENVVLDGSLQPFNQSALIHSLFKLPPTSLRLQLDPEMDLLDWEDIVPSGLAGRESLGQRFAVSRFLLETERAAREADSDKAPAVPLKVLRVAGRSSRHASREPDQDRAHQPDIRTCSIEEIRMFWDLQQWDLVVLETDAAQDPLCRVELDHVVKKVNLVWLSASRASPVLAVRNRLLEVTDSLLVFSDPAPDPIDQSTERLLDRFCDLWATGLRTSDVVRRLPRENLRLYGDSSRLPLLEAGPRQDSSMSQVTSMSFDLVGSTSLMFQVGSERYSLLLSQFHQACRDAILAYGGRPDAPQGDDGLMAYFGFPVSSEGSARKAVQAALKMVKDVESLGLEVRIGIATGRVAVRGQQPIGLSVHMAARLQSLAPPNAILVSDAVRQLVGSSVDIEHYKSDVMVKGLQSPETVYTVRRALDQSQDRSRPKAVERSAFVGREDALRRLDERYFAMRNGAGSSVLIRGEAGIGKSRLLHEWRKRIESPAHRFFSLHGNPDHRSSPFLALVEGLRASLGMSPDADAATLIDGVRKHLPELGIANDTLDEHLLRNLVEPAAGSGKRSGHLAALGPDQIRENTLQFLSQRLQQLADRQSLCVLIDDLQWIDPSTLELLARLEKQVVGSRLLLIATLRTEAKAPQATLRTQHVFDLPRLSHEQSLSLIRGRLGNQVLEASLVEQAVLRSEGVPLFLEETLRMLFSQRQGDTSEKMGSDWLQQVPSTLQELLQARLDLVGSAKKVAQIASVFGRDFSRDAVHEVLVRLNDDIGVRSLDAQLGILATEGLVQALEGPSEAGQYRFRHILIRDTAYYTLWENDRRHLHHLAVEVLRRSSAAMESSQPELLAIHLSAAGEASEAVQMWERAAKLAVRNSAQEEAIRLLEEALKEHRRLATDEADAQQELRLRMSLAARVMSTRGYGADEAKNSYHDALSLAKSLDDQASLRKIYLGLEAFHFMRAEFDEALNLARAALYISAHAFDSWEHIQVLWAEANVNWHKGHLDLSLNLMDQCLGLYREDMHRPSTLQDPAVMCLCYSSWCCFEMGNLGEAERRVEEGLALSRRLGHSFSIGVAHGFRASLMLFAGRYPEALAEAEQAYRVCLESGYRVWLAHALMIKGRALVGLGKADEGLRQLAEAYELWTQTGAIVTRPFYLALQAEACISMGKVAQAIVAIDEALRIAEATGEHYHKAELLRMKASTLVVDVHPGQGLDQACALLRQAIVLARSQGKTLFALRSASALLRLTRDPAQASLAAQQIVDLMAIMPQDQHKALSLEVGAAEWTQARALHQTGTAH